MLDLCNQFVADVPAEKADLIYLCFPNNPTGAVYSRETLVAIAELAVANGIWIICDDAMWIRNTGVRFNGRTCGWRTGCL